MNIGDPDKEKAKRREELWDSCSGLAEYFMEINSQMEEGYMEFIVID